jgi:hypothetical protein
MDGACEQQAAELDATSSDGGETMRNIAASVQILNISIDGKNDATVVFSLGLSSDAPTTTKRSLERVDGRWLLK